MTTSSRRAWLCGAIAALSAQALSGEELSSGALPNVSYCRPAHESWLIDSGCNGELQFYRFDRRRGWRSVTRMEFIHAQDTSLPTTFYVHGYGANRNQALADGDRVACAASSPTAFRLVTWVWPSRHRPLYGPARNLSEKTVTANAQGIYLAGILADLDPQLRLSLVAHSLGCRTVCNALHAIAIGRVPAATDRAVQMMLIAPALDVGALLPGGQFGGTRDVAQRLCFTHNPSDMVLRILARVQGGGSLLGLTGLGRWPVAQSRVAQFATECYVGHRHLVSVHMGQPGLVAKLRPYLVNHEPLN